jgi:hypothetical protein
VQNDPVGGDHPRVLPIYDLFYDFIQDVPLLRY